MSKGEETRNTILDEALRLASRVGFTGLTIGLVAERTEMSKSGLFAHFRSKEQLQLQALDHGRRRFVDVVLRPALTTERGEKRLRALVEHWLVWGTETLPGGCVFLAGAAEFDDQPGPMRDAIAAAQRDFLDSLTTVVRAGVDTGDFRPEIDPEQTAFELFGLILGFHHHARLLDDPRATERVRTAFDALLDRLRPD